MNIFTTDENRAITSRFFAWVGLIAGSVGSALSAFSIAYRSMHGLDRSSDAALAFGGVTSLLSLLVAVPSSLYSHFLLRNRKAIIGLLTAIFGFVSAVLAGFALGGHS